MFSCDLILQDISLKKVILKLISPFAQTCIYHLWRMKNVIVSKLKEYKKIFQSNGKYLTGLCMYLQNSLFIEINLDSF